MPNTCNPLPDLARRLDTLAEKDAVTADQLRACLAAATALVPAAPDAPRNGHAKALVARWMARDAENRRPDLVFVLGSGAGDELQALADALPAESRLMLLDTDPAAAARLFARWSLDPLIAENRLALSLGRDETHAVAQFGRLMDLKQMSRVRIFDVLPATEEAARHYTAVLRRCKEKLRTEIFNVNTLLHLGAKWQHNTLKNLPCVAVNPGVQALVGCWKDKPAIVVAAGPSLNDALPHLKRLADRFAIISTATALKALRHAGIRPALVAAVDSEHPSAPQYETTCDDLYLICTTAVYPSAMPKFKGVFSAETTANPIDPWLRELAAPRGYVSAGGTVTITALDMAIQMGCNPVLTVGYDLSFRDDGTTHAAHTMYHGCRLDPASLLRVPGNYTDTVLTEPLMNEYIQANNAYVASFPGVRFININTGGARLKGMELRHPEELETFAAAPFDAYAAVEACHGAHVPPSLGPLRKALDRAAERLATIQQHATQAAMITNRLILLLRAPHAGDEAEAQGLLDTIAQGDEAIAQNLESSPLIEMSLRPICFQMGAKPPPQEQRLSQAIQLHRRYREFYEQVAGAAKWTRYLILEALARLPAAEESASGADGAPLCAEADGAHATPWNREHGGNPAAKAASEQ